MSWIVLAIVGAVAVAADAGLGAMAVALCMAAVGVLGSLWGNLVHAGSRRDIRRAVERAHAEEGGE